MGKGLNSDKHDNHDAKAANYLIVFIVLCTYNTYALKRVHATIVANLSHVKNNNIYLIRIWMQFDNIKAGTLGVFKALMQTTRNHI